MILHEWAILQPNKLLDPRRPRPHTWVVIDWDLRRWIQVTGPAEPLLDEGDAIAFVVQYVDQLGPRIQDLRWRRVPRSSLGRRPGLGNPVPRSHLPETLGAVSLIPRSELIEMDRMSVCVDLVMVRSSSEVVVFQIYHHPEAGEIHLERAPCSTSAEGPSIICFPPQRGH